MSIFGFILVVGFRIVGVGRLIEFWELFVLWPAFPLLVACALIPRGLLVITFGVIVLRTIVSGFLISFVRLLFRS